jgi:hypothetical protein
MNRQALWCAAVFFVCLPASAQINKCVDARGRVSYQEQPCPGAKIERFSATAPAAAPAAAAEAMPPASAPQVDNLRSQCPHAFADIEKARANMPNLKPGEQERLREVLEQEEALWRKRCG